MVFSGKARTRSKVFVLLRMEACATTTRIRHMCGPTGSIELQPSISLCNLQQVIYNIEGSPDGGAGGGAGGGWG